MNSTRSKLITPREGSDSHNWFRLFFFFNFLGNGILMPYLALFLASKGVQGVSQGIALGVLPLARIVAQPLWGVLGDAYKIHRPILTGSLFGLAGVALILTRIQGFWPAFFVILLFAAMDAPYIPMGTTLALDYLERRGEPELFGPLRVWGSVGYMTSALLIGSLLLENHLQLLPYLFAGAMAISGLLSLTLPHPEHESGQVFRLKDSLTLLTGRPGFGVFLLGILLCGATVSIGSQYLPVHLEKLHAAGWMIGLSMGLQASMELPLMGSMPAILRRFGIPTAMLIGVLVLPVRWILHVIIQQPLLLMPVQLLHGFTIAGTMVVGALWVSRKLPDQLRATGQSLYAAVFSGVGWGLGLLAAGAFNDWFGMNSVWLMAAAVSTLGVVLIWGVLKYEETAH